MSNASGLGLFTPRKRGLAFIVSAPSGTGKTTLVEMLTNEFPNVVANVSFTTRAPRPGEIAGKHYHFITHEEFAEQIVNDEFLDHVKLYETYYGCSRKWVEGQLSEGKHVILTIDTQGARHLKQILFPAISIFVAPPSREELRRRLLMRRTEPEEMIQKRLDWAEEEFAASHDYDYRFVNADLGMAYQVLRSIVIAEVHRLKDIND